MGQKKPKKTKTETNKKNQKKPTQQQQKKNNNEKRIQYRNIHKEGKIINAINCCWNDCWKSNLIWQCNFLLWGCIGI